MATRDQLYAKFGVAAEAAQLFETDLGTIWLAIEGWINDWHRAPDPREANEFYSKLNRKTLGQLLNGVKSRIGLNESVASKFQQGLDARNQLYHGFFERHGYGIQTEQGRDAMVRDLEALHSQLFEAWQDAQKLAGLLTDAIKSGRPN